MAGCWSWVEAVASWAIQLKGRCSTLPPKLGLRPPIVPWLVVGTRRRWVTVANCWWLGGEESPGHWPRLRGSIPGGTRGLGCRWRSPKTRASPSSHFLERWPNERSPRGRLTAPSPRRPAVHMVALSFPMFTIPLSGWNVLSPSFHPCIHRGLVYCRCHVRSGAPDLGLGACPSRAQKLPVSRVQGHRGLM